MTESKPYRAIPQQPQAQELRNRILAEAARLVGSVGSENVTTIDVARAAGSSVGAVYRLFPDKHGMLAAVAERHIETIIARMPKKYSTAEKAAAGVVRVLTDMNRDEPAFAQLNVGAQITCMDEDGWMGIAYAIHIRLTEPSGFQPMITAAAITTATITAAALAGANAIITQSVNHSTKHTIAVAIATSLLADVLKPTA
jgi:AcrR family transcriptional regulator